MIIMTSFSADHFIICLIRMHSSIDSMEPAYCICVTHACTPLHGSTWDHDFGLSTLTNCATLLLHSSLPYRFPGCCRSIQDAAVQIVTRLGGIGHGGWVINAREAKRCTLSSITWQMTSSVPIVVRSLSFNHRRFAVRISHCITISPRRLPAFPCQSKNNDWKNKIKSSTSLTDRERTP